jgi:hypothetical protein
MGISFAPAVPPSTSSSVKYTTLKAAPSAWVSKATWDRHIATNSELVHIKLADINMKSTLTTAYFYLVLNNYKIYCWIKALLPDFNCSFVRNTDRFVS